MPVMRKTSLVLVTALLALVGVAAAPAAHAEPNQSVKAIDSANIITDPAWFVNAYNDGIRLYVTNSTFWGTCQPWDRTQSQLQMALDAGLKIAVYTRDPNCWREGIAATGPYQSQLEFFGLDVEWGGPPITRVMVDGVKSLGVRPVVYSGCYMWAEIMGGNAEFSDLPLWDSNVGPVDYPNWSADLLAPTQLLYGGWNTPDNMRIGIQQKLEHNLNGVNVDLNSFDAGFLNLG